jgi:hypothetical protein
MKFVFTMLSLHSLLPLLTSMTTAQHPLPIATNCRFSSSAGNGFERAQQTLDRQAAGFIENKGQWDARARFLLRTSGPDSRPITGRVRSPSH